MSLSVFYPDIFSGAFDNSNAGQKLAEMVLMSVQSRSQTFAYKPSNIIILSLLINVIMMDSTMELIVVSIISDI